MHAAIGFTIHTGWAATVTLAEDPVRIFDRRRVELAADRESRFVYHAASEDRGKAEGMVAEARDVARARARQALQDVQRATAEWSLIVAVRAPKKALPPLDTILKSHPLIHLAEGELFRQAVVDAAEELKLPVFAASVGSVPQVGRVGPPWGKDQKDAAALAWAALRVSKKG